MPHAYSNMGDIMVCFGCWGAQARVPPRKRRTIDRAMIGLPTDFRHTGHIGAGDVGGDSHINILEHQMSSKGGYDKISTGDGTLKLDCIPIQVQS